MFDMDGWEFNISIHWHNDEHWWTSYVHVNRLSAYQPSVIHLPPLLGDCFSWLKSWTICSTLIDSTPGVYKAWETFATDYALGDYREITHATHGRRLCDTLRELCKINDEAKLLVGRNRPLWGITTSNRAHIYEKSEIDRFEDEVIEGSPTALPGAIKLVSGVKLIS